MGGVEGVGKRCHVSLLCGPTKDKQGRLATGPPKDADAIVPRLTPRQGREGSASTEPSRVSNSSRLDRHTDRSKTVSAEGVNTVKTKEPPTTRHTKVFTPTCQSIIYSSVHAGPGNHARVLTDATVYSYPLL